LIADLVQKEWDVIIIGAGLGGGTVGRRLAEKGMSVLFVEAGPFGPRAEQHRFRNDVFDPMARRVRGYLPTPIQTTIDGRQSEFFALLGAGVGGSSAFYAATLERPERHDIDDSDGRPHPTGGWPETYEAFRPYFSEAERLYQVCGEDDPLSGDGASNLHTPPAIGAGDRALKERFKQAGLNPYHVHLGVRFLPGCQLCFGSKCPRKCKMDGRSAGVEPALETGHAAILDMCDVRALRGTGNSISHIEATRGGETFHLRAKRYVIAGGALGSARLLLVSASEAWPRGCANSSGMVGRNLMFHLTEMLAIWSRRAAPFEGPTKTISLRDFYYHEGHRYGALADMGIEASYGEIVHFLNNLFDRSALRKLRRLRGLTRIPAFIGSRVFGKAKIMAGLIEDLPYQDNRVLLDEGHPDRIRIEYRISAELHQRRRHYRRLVKSKLRGERLMFLNYEPELNIPHACGTLRFGNDPASSVLDASCRAHDVHNLYAADSSFMPTSTGINPGLTIAANALRVADRISAQIS
jgi:choline dehydrogenase-like flavoprotein